jgi:predicted permease
VQLVEVSRDAWGFGTADAFWQDVRYAARRLRQRPGFTASVVGILALGIGATTAMFSAVDAAMLRPLPFLRPGELVTLNRINIPFDPGGGRVDDEQSFDITQPMSMRDVFVSVASYASGGLNLADPEHPRRLTAGVVSGDFFTTIGVNAAQGRTIAHADGLPNAPKVVVISWAMWQGDFGGRDVIGSTIPLSSARYEIIGIMPRDFAFPAQSDVWIPMSIPTTRATFEPFRGYLPSVVIARLTAGVTSEHAEARMREAWQRVASTFPRVAGQEPDIARSLRSVLAEGATESLRATLVSDRRTALLVLLATTALLLLIACANVTNLLLSYGAARGRELAVRSVLGATRPRILRQLLAESVMLSVLGAAVGIGIAPMVLGVLRTMMPTRLAGLAPVQLDLRVLAFATVLAVLTGILFGLWPAFGATHGSTVTAIKSGGGHGASASGARRSQRLLVGAEIALAGVLLVGAGLMLRSFQKLVNTESGLSADRVATLELSFQRGNELSVKLQRLEAVLAELRRQPGVVAAGAVNDLPLRGTGGIGVSVKVEGAPKSADENYPRYLVASDGYFESMRIRLKRGRYFASHEADENVAIISESMAKIYWPEVDPVGRTFLFGGDPPPLTVVGVVADVREAGLEREPGPQMYLLANRNLGTNAAIIARGSGNLSDAALLAALRQAVRNVDPAQAVYNVRMMDQVIGTSMAARKANTLLITLFGVLAVLIAVLGVYAVAANAVAQRAREFGIRIALGASRADVLRHVSGEMIAVVTGGVFVGAAIAWAASRVMTGLV